MYRRLFVNLLLVFPIIFGGVLIVSGDAVAASKQTLTAAYVKSAPKGLDDSVWNQAKAEDVHFEGKERFAGQNASVTTKAVYTDDSIYFLFNPL